MLMARAEDVLVLAVGDQAPDAGYAEEIMRLTNRRGVDVVIEQVTEATWPKSARAVVQSGQFGAIVLEVL